MTHPTPEQPGPIGNTGGVPGAPAQNFPAPNPYPAQNPYPGQDPAQAPAQAPAQGPGQGYPAGAPQQGQPYPAQQFPAQQPQAQYPQAQQPGVAGHAPGVRGKSPFSAITARDYTMDAIALTLLIISLFLPWRASFSSSMDVSTLAASRIEVLLVTILSMLSLGLTYVWRSGAFGPSWNYKRMQDVRLLANAPYFIVVVVYLVLELVSPRALGSAVAFGLAGALLAATPRQSELGEAQLDTARDKRWLLALLVLAGLASLTVLIQTVRYLVDFANAATQAGGLGASYLSPLYPVSGIILGLLTPVLLVMVALKVAQKSQTWRLVGIGIGAAGLLLGFIAMAESSRVAASFHGAGTGFTVVFWMAFGAVSAAPSLGRLVVEQPSLQKWQSVSKTALLLALAGSAAVALVAVVNLIRVLTAGSDVSYYSRETPVVWVLSLIFAAVSIAGFFVAGAALKNGTRQGQQLATAYAGLLFVLFLVLVIVGANTVAWGLMGLAVILAFVLPIAIAVILWSPKAMREHFGTLAATGTANTGFSFDGVHQAQAAPLQQAPGQPASSQQAPGATYNPAVFQAPQVPGVQPVDTSSTVAPALAAQAAAPAAEPVTAAQALAEASNPATSPARLYELAVSHPNTHAAIAANPSVYPGLSDWLATQGTPTSVVEPAAVEPITAEPAAAETKADVAAEDSALTNVVRRDPAAGVEALLAEAANPATAPIRLQELAVQHPETHAALTANPSTYQGLRDWLALQTTAAQDQAHIADEVPAGETVVVNRSLPSVESTMESPADSPVETPAEPLVAADPLVAEAADPATSPARLHELAAAYPQVHAAIAGNPSAYPQLLEWLAGINGPGVAEALQQR